MILFFFFGVIFMKQITCVVERADEMNSSHLTLQFSREIYFVGQYYCLKCTRALVFDNTPVA